MFCVGLTGPIGSGKSTVAMLFEKLGVKLISADQIARQLTTKGQPALAKIIDHFGSGFLDHNGELQRRLLRERIFKHPQQRLWLEQLLHPLIRHAIETRLQDPPKLYYMVEIPVLKNKQDYPYLNRTLVVMTEPQIQQQRVMQRDGHSAEEVQRIIEAQADELAYRNLADDIITNNGSLQDLVQSISQLHRTYCQLSLN